MLSDDCSVATAINTRTVGGRFDGSGWCVLELRGQIAQLITELARLNEMPRVRRAHDAPLVPCSLERSKVTCEWLAWLVYQKLWRLTPLDRIRRDLTDRGVPIAMSTLVTIIERAAELLSGVDGLHWKQLQAAPGWLPSSPRRTRSRRARSSRGLEVLASAAARSSRRASDHFVLIDSHVMGAPLSPASNR